MTRKKSVVWGFFKTVDSESVQCLICSGYQYRHVQGSTSAMLRHLRVKHPREVAKKCLEQGLEAVPSSGHPDMDTDSEQSCSVEVTLEDGDSPAHTNISESDISSSINGIMDATQEGPAERTTLEEAGENHPVRQNRHKRSVIWKYYECLDSMNAVQCRICMKNLKRFKGSGTSNLHRHMSKRHPELFSKLLADGLNPPQTNLSQSSNPNGGRLIPPKTSETTDQAQFSVEVTLEDGDSPAHTNISESDISSAINGIVDASQEGPAEQITLGQASENHPVRQNRHKRSVIWKYYKCLDSLNAVQCRICMKKLQRFEGSSTSNLRRHMSKRHPELFSTLLANRLNPPQTNLSQSSNPNGGRLIPPEMTGTAEQTEISASRTLEGEKRVWRTERELIEALRRTQREEAQALEQQRELLKKLRAVNAREAAAEREKIESLRKSQQEEANELNRQREELQREKAELQKKREELQHEREELLLFSQRQ